MKDFIIPIDGVIKEFFDHLKANPRTILSSKFGDGKSYFLNNFKETDYVQEHFTFLTIYPVNYQVVSNEDIFTLIKHDILFQLLLNDMVSNQIVVSTDVALWFYMQNKGESLLSDLMYYLSAIAIPNEHKPAILTGMKTLKLFKDLKSKFDKFKEKYNEDALLEDFLKNADASTIYEEDIVTSIIKKTIENYKLRTKKEVVLIVEDMDRIDPAHIFRILNIFSAHIDYCYKNFVKPNDTLIGNKFGLSNIMLVCDHTNIRKIFKHLYGEHTDFSGYIGKFLSSMPFYYSLREERIKYVYEQLATITECPKELLQYVIEKSSDSIISNKTIREIVHTLDLEKELSYEVSLNIDGANITLCPIMLRVLSIMRRLGFSDDSMKDIAEDVFEKKAEYFFCYIAPYMLLLNKENKRLGASIFYKSSDSYYRQDFLVDEKTGKGRRGSLFISSSREEKTDFPAIIECMLKYVVR